MANSSVLSAQVNVSSAARSSAVRLNATEVLARPVTVHLSQVRVEDAVKKIAAEAHVRVQYADDVFDGLTTCVTLQTNQAPLGAVMRQALSGTHLAVVVLRSDLVAIKQVTALTANGVITGKVMNAQTKQPLSGVTITLDDESRGLVTDQDGVFRLPSVSAGTHRITVRLVGYTRQVKVVNVADGEIATVDVVLQSSVNTLDQVVVTGTIIPTERKAVPNAMTVITAKDLEQRGITRMNELFRGDVPGMFVMNSGSSAPFGIEAMFSRGATALSNKSVGVTTVAANTVGAAPITNAIKTYVDGVELAQPLDLLQMDPKSIERIEILTGPQASTIYGSNAINGVMQIFTKRGTTNTPQLTLNLQSGWTENNLSSALAPRHDDNAQLSGVGGPLSYYGNGSWNYTGSWTPGVRVAKRTGSGGVRLELPTPAGRVTTDLSLRRMLNQNTGRGAQDQITTDYNAQGFYRNSQLASGVVAPSTTQLADQSMGLTLTYQPTTWWSHEAMTGQDGASTEVFTTGKGYSTVNDSTLYVSFSYLERRSLRYASTMRIPMTALANATLTAGADAWQMMGYSWSGRSNSSLFALSSPSLSRSRDHNTGAFLQGQLGIVERLYFTYGVRAEFNPAIGAKAKVLPGRMGVAYSQEIGGVTAKVRGSYGRSIRPPNPYYQLGTLASVYGTLYSDQIAAYGKNLYTQLPNPEIVPEYQQGGEGGLELYLGSRGSLVITRYNQTVDGLIDNVPVADSARSLMPYALLDGFETCAQLIAWYGGANDYCSSQDADGYAYYPQSEYLNIGSIRNQGWELQGTINIGSFSTHGTYSWTKSRVIGITPKFRTFFTPRAYPQYQPGASFKYMPAHTYAWGVTYTNATTTAGVNINGVGQIVTLGSDLVYKYLNTAIRLPQNRLNFAPASYLSVNHGYPLASLTLSHHVTTRFEGTLQVQNVFDKYQNDVSSNYPTAGRQTSLGLRVRL